jgi:trehalose 6-phosphate phosphatase
MSLPPVWGLDQALARLGSAATVLLALDFDGTLAHLVDNPDDARMLPASRVALTSLGSEPGVTVALVSGRGAKNLVEVSHPERNWWLIGSHGMEQVAPGEDPPEAPPAHLVDKRSALWADFARAAEGGEGVWVEKKTWGAALHTRGTAPDVEREAHERLRGIISSWADQVVTRTGHGLIESSLGTKTKGDGVGFLKTEVSPEVTLFMGDDRTDEDGFRALEPADVGVRVGGGETIAPFELAGPDEVAQFLAELARRRTV